MEREEVSTRRGWLGLIPTLVVIAYGSGSILAAIRHGMFQWGALGDYSMCPYVLALGLVCSGLVFVQGRPERLETSFLLLFFSFGLALELMKPAVVPPGFRWVFDFMNVTTWFAVMAAAVVLEQRWRARRTRP